VLHVYRNAKTRINEKYRILYSSSIKLIALRLYWSGEGCQGMW